MFRQLDLKKQKIKLIRLAVCDLGDVTKGTDSSHRLEETPTWVLSKIKKISVSIADRFFFFRWANGLCLLCFSFIVCVITRYTFFFSFFFLIFNIFLLHFYCVAATTSWPKRPCEVFFFFFGSLIFQCDIQTFPPSARPIAGPSWLQRPLLVWHEH